MTFDIERKGTGTKEWAEHSFNIQLGCSNGCLYCYARADALRRKRISCRSEWENETLIKNSGITSFPKKSGVIMFPTTSDITPFNLEAYIRVAKLILKKGNRLLVVSKPRMECISALLTEFEPWKEQILFRFTIGSMNDATCFFWEPGAPDPQERVACLRTASEKGYKTSVSIEPMLSGINDAGIVVDYCRRFVTDTIWVGKMNKVRLRVGEEHAAAVTNIERMQRDELILSLYDHFRYDSMIRWKDSIKQVIIGKEG